MKTKYKLIIIAGINSLLSIPIALMNRGYISKIEVIFLLMQMIILTLTAVHVVLDYFKEMKEYEIN